MRLATGWRRAAGAAALLLLVAFARHGSALLERQLGTDEVDYTAAFAAAAAGEDPYAIPRFLYPPAFVLAGAAAQRAWGLWPTVLLLRGLNLAGAVLVVWSGLAWTAWPDRAKLGVGALLLLGWGPFQQAFAEGNVSLAVVGLLLTALVALPRRPVGAGAALGASLAVKPLGPAIVALLPAATPRRVAVRATFAASAGAALTLAWGAPRLPHMLARTAAELAPRPTVSLWRLAHCAGLDLPPTILLAAVVLGGWVALRRAPRTPAAFAVVASTAALYATPLVWTHTLALSLPAQALAFDRAFASWRGAAEPSAARRRAGYRVAVLAAFALAIQGSAALGVVSGGSRMVEAACLLGPVLAPAVFATAALAREAPAPAPASGMARPVGQ